MSTLVRAEFPRCRRVVLAAGAVACLCLTWSASSAYAAVKVSKVNNVLYVTGDDFSDYVEIDGTDTVGKVEVYAEGKKLGTFHEVESIEVDLGPGTEPNSLEVSGIEITGDLTCYGGGGQDFFDIDVETNYTHVFRDVFIGGNLFAALGGGEYDSVFIRCGGNNGNTNHKRSVHIGGDTTLFSASTVNMYGAGPHPDTGVGREITIDGMITIWSNAGEPRVPMMGAFHFKHVVVAGSTVVLHTGNFDSECALLGSYFAGPVAILMGGTVDDFVKIGAQGSYDTPEFANVFEDEVKVNLGQGFDTVFNSKFNVYAVPPVFSNVEDIQ